MADLNADDLATLSAWMEAGKIVPVIERTYSLGEVPAAIGYVEAGHARAKVVVTVQNPGPGVAAKLAR
jgi:NADPH:quinone reductase-like Zn-dependent oxidoreductase